MARKTRKRFTAQEKVAILRLHLLEHVAISDLCDRHGIHPTMFYRWQKEFFENGATAFEPRSRRPADSLDGAWVPQATWDAAVRFVRHWAGRTGISLVLLAGWLGIAMSKFSRWDRRLGIPNRHNAPIPRSSWLEDWEKAAIVAFHDRYPLEGYRRLAYMMLDADVVAVSPSSVYRVQGRRQAGAPRREVLPEGEGLRAAPAAA
ncbi:transposase [Singulisphaera acidiphila]|uniref:transposase n=1 Tax=Singulisphaera acidiphila TaxID=466153 RepID=UPI0002470C37|nr:transposase [Singulisphaera acidiphila]